MKGETPSMLFVAFLVLNKAGALPPRKKNIRGKDKSVYGIDCGVVYYIVCYIVYSTRFFRFKQQIYS